VKYRENNFDLIRLVAAFQVVIVHSAEHLSLDIPFLGIISLFPGVPIFFVISGYLISASYERSMCISEYWKNRVLRIFPGLWFCLLISIVSVFGFLSIDPSFDFWLWLVAQLTFVQFYNPDFLRGYGVGVLNGSLWTITVELQFYLSLPIFYWILRKCQYKNYVFLLIWIPLIFYGQFFNEYKGTSIYFKVIGITVFPYLYLFLLGVYIQRNKWIEKILVKKFFYLLVIYLSLSTIFNKCGLIVEGNQINIVSAMFLGLLTISAAYSSTSTLSKILKGNDISYGLYIYHMIFINMAVEYGFENFISFFAVIFCSILMSCLSWLYVEKPSLKLKKHSLRKQLEKEGQVE